MLVTNSFADDIIVFVYDVGDLLYFAALRDPSLHLLTFAESEVTIPAGQSARITHGSAPNWHVGVKRGSGLGRFEPFLAPLDGQAFDATADLEFTADRQLVWRNAPKIVNPTPRLPEAELMRPLPPAPGHVIGVGRANITDAAVLTAESALPMQGWTSPSQTTQGIEKDGAGAPIWLEARAFLIGDPGSRTRAVFVVADIWSCSIAIKQEVVRRLSYGNPESPYRMDTVWIAGTHTHSAPAGYLHHFLYNAVALGFDAHMFESVVAGIVAAVEAAHAALGPGRVQVARGTLDWITRNRSEPAFANNPAAERAAFPGGVDTDMTLLLFEREDPPGSGGFTPVGALNWFAIHPTNLGEEWRLVSGDNKGHAARLMEAAMGAGFVAGFANGCAGDVSGNFKPGAPDFDPVNTDLFQDHVARMMDAAQAQADVALRLAKSGGAILTGPVEAQEHRVDLRARTGAPAALGLSMAAGSSEDGGDKGVPEGITLLDITDPARTSVGLMTVGAIATSALLPVNRILAAVTGLVSGQPLAALRGALSALPVTDAQMLAAHFPKPILLTPGLMQPDPWTPEVLQLQLVRIGPFAALGVPAEVTTVAGLRLRQAVRDGLSGVGAEMVVVGTYTNGYASYVTTPEEYDAQHYEGASTLFGRGTCPALQGAATELAKAMAAGGAPVPDAPLPDLAGRVLTKRRMTFRNLAQKTDVTIRICASDDTTRLAPLWPDADFILPAGADRAVAIPLPFSLATEVVQVLAYPPSGSPRRARRLLATTTDLILVPQRGAPLRSAYFPTARMI